MRTVILGANGQLGTDLRKAFADWPLTHVTRADFDICDTPALQAFLAQARPQLVVNTTAFHHLDTCEAQPEKAFAVNAIAVRDLAATCRDRNATLVHLSTDYVFGGDLARTAPYTESDTPAPVNTYGVSKVAGEHLVRAMCPKHFIVRTCGLYGTAGASGKGRNFVELMVRLAKEGKPIRVVTDQVLTPTATADVANTIKELVRSEVYGTYHVTSEGQCSWYEFAEAIFRRLRLSPEFRGQTSAESGAKTRRPAYSVLAQDGLRKVGLPPMRPWSDALAEYLRAQGHDRG